MKIDLHIIQSFSPANLNRDESNQPKDCEFGGVRRARISSQCIKRSIRFHPKFSEMVKEDTGLRTRWLARPLIASLIKNGKTEADAQAVVNSYVENLTKSEKNKDTGIAQTNVLVYYSPAEIELMTKALIKDWENIKKYVTSGGEKKDKDEKESPYKTLNEELIKKSKNRPTAPDIALFGRMLADDPSFSIDAACQVAHAISTHRVSMEMDFFTAVDDLQESSEAGAGMMGIIPFNSACFYRYANLDHEQLLDNLQGDEELTKRTIKAFLAASVYAIPSGKQTSFAAINLPNFVLAVINKDNLNFSLTSAFEKPVAADRVSGLVVPSLFALDDYWGRIQRSYGLKEEDHLPIAFCAEDGSSLANLKPYLKKDVSEWLQAVEAAL